MTCYRKSNNNITDFSESLLPCGTSSFSSAQACCTSGDLCLSDFLCHFSDPGLSNGGGYYTAGCTDPTFKDPACSQSCTDLPFQNVVYNRTTNMWACCGEESCATPTNETFTGPAPDELEVIATPAALAASTSPTSQSSSPVPVVTGNSSTPFSNEVAAVGIAIGASVVLVSLAALIIWRICICRRARKEHHPEHHPAPPQMPMASGGPCGPCPWRNNSGGAGYNGNGEGGRPPWRSGSSTDRSAGEAERGRCPWRDGAAANAGYHSKSQSGSAQSSIYSRDHWPSKISTLHPPQSPQEVAAPYYPKPKAELMASPVPI